MALGLRVARALVLLVLGAGVGVLSVAVHGLLVGFVLLVVATGATAYALPGGWSTRLPFCLGWVAVAYDASRSRDVGGYLVAADVHGYALLAFGIAVLLFGTVTLARPAPRRSAGDPGNADAAS